MSAPDRLTVAICRQCSQPRESHRCGSDKFDLIEYRRSYISDELGAEAIALAAQMRKSLER